MELDTPEPLLPTTTLLYKLSSWGRSEQIHLVNPPGRV